MNTLMLSFRIRNARFMREHREPGNAFGNAPPQSQPSLARKGLVLGDIGHCRSGSAFHKMMDHAGFDLTSNPEDDYCFAIKWSPWSSFEITPDLRRSVKTGPIVNDTHFKCNKSNVAQCFEERTLTSLFK